MDHIMTPSFKDIIGSWDDTLNSGVASDDNDSDNSGSNSHPPKYFSWNQETEVKQLMNPEPDISGTEKAEILKLIRSLNKEQEELRKRQEEQEREQGQLKRMHEEHDKSLKELMQRQPSFKKRLDSLGYNQKAPGKDVLRPRCPPPAPPQIHNPPETQVAATETEHLYVQIQQLYCNFQRMTIVTNKSNPDDANNDSLENPYSMIKDVENSVALKQENRQLKYLLGFLKTKRRSHSSDKHGSERMRQSMSMTDLTLETITPHHITGRPVPRLPMEPPRLIPVEVTFEWLIKDFTKSMHRERRNPGTKTETSPFYLYHCGYRAQLEVYLNGNGQSVGRCMSVFLRIVSGDFDSTLRWPLSIYLTVILINQEGNRNASLRPTRNSRHMFQYNRPTCDDVTQSDAWGLVEFVRHDILREKSYVRDDAIKLRCKLKFMCHKSGVNGPW